MIALLSPAKRLREEPVEGEGFTCPQMLDQTQILVEKLKTFSIPRIRKLMGVSDSIAELNHMRYQSYETPFTEQNSFPALLGFQGDVYQNIHTDEYEAGDFEFAQENLRILSGLYGVLRPMDRIFPYRLEMGTPLSNKRGKDLYKFWGKRITDLLCADLQSHKEKVLINLASKEYFQAVKADQLQARLIHIHFKENKGGKLKVIGLMAKRARGMMADYIVRNRIEDSEDLLSFQEGGYRFESELSSDTDWVFING